MSSVLPRTHKMITRSQAKKKQEQMPKKMVPISTDDLAKRAQILERHVDILERENRYLRARLNTLTTENETLSARLKSLQEKKAEVAPPPAPAKTRDFSQMARFLGPGEVVYVGSADASKRMTAYITLNKKREPVIMYLGNDFKSPEEFCEYYAKAYKKVYNSSEDHWASVKVYMNNKSLAEIYDEGIQKGL